MCYICFDDSTDEELLNPCKCLSRPVHKACLARWQIQCQGKNEETHCRFCNERLPDWRTTVVDAETTPIDDQLRLSIRVCFNGEEKIIYIRPGPQGRQDLIEQMEKYNIDVNVFDVIFETRVPPALRRTTTAGADEKLRFNGMACFDAVSAIACQTKTKRIA